VDCLRPKSGDYFLIPCASPHAQYLAHKDDIQAAIQRVLEGNSYILGKEVAEFEAAFAAYCDPNKKLIGVGLNSGTDALILAMRALNVGRGDEVVTVSHTANATVAAVIATGAVPVLIDIDPVFYTLDPNRLESAITSRTRAIIAVHLYGQPADMDEINIIARRHGLPVIEDCAQAAGATYKGKRTGNLGTLSCFSFYPTKNLGAIGDGGMVLTANKVLAERIRCLRQYGWNKSRHTCEVGINSRLDELQAAVLNAKLRFLDSDNERRRKIAERYNNALPHLSLTLPVARPNSRHVYHLYVIACDDRDSLMAGLAKAGIKCGIHYPLPVHCHRGYDKHVVLPTGRLPLTEHLAVRILSLPIYPELGENDVERVIAAVTSHYTR
jgi:dTDP-4-amino-4,6-dideoxygalactose transaminase